MKVEAQVASREVKDNGMVGMGALSPSFPHVRVTPPAAKDRLDVRMGALSPAFPRAG